MVCVLISASGGERTLDLGSEDLAASTFSSAIEMSRPGKNSSSATSLTCLICQVGPLLGASLVYRKDRNR